LFEMKDSEHDELWDLLGRVKQTESSPFFTAKVLAATRRLNEGRQIFWKNWVRFGLPGALAGAMAVFLAVGIHLGHIGNRHSQKDSGTQASPTDLEVIADLDHNLSSEESSVWVDPSVQ
jgi:hypothetical protein